MPEYIIEEGDGGYYGDGHRHHHHRHHRSSSRHHRRGWQYTCFPCLAYRKPRMRSRQRFHMAAAIAFIAALSAFVLYLLAALSLPIIKPIYLLQINFKTGADQPATSVATNLRFGVWGFCASSVLDLPTVFSNNGECTPIKLGYTLPPDVLSLIGFPPELTDAVLKVLTILLVLHPVAAGLALAMLVCTLFTRSQFVTVLALIDAILTAIVGSVVLAADLALVIEANRKINQELGGLLTVSFGNAVWMIVAAVAMSWLAVIALSAIACRCCGIRRKHGWYGDGYYG